MPANNHIVIACSYLHVPGGYEKAMITTASLFAEKGHKVTLLILDDPAGTFYPVHPGVSILHQPMNFGITEKGNTISRKFWLWKDIRNLKSIVKELRPAHLICSEYPFAAGAIMAGAKKICRVYSWEHHHYGAQHVNRFWQSVTKRTYRKLDAVICLNKDEQQHYISLNDKAVVIPNFIAKPENTDPPAGKEFSLISVTRFNHIKGIDLLMQVAGVVLPQNPQMKWKVIGYGEQKDAFLGFIQKEKLSGQLIYQAADKTDITAEYRSADIFVMTSRNECFPLVLLEAMSNGLPCIAFDCDTGPRHIIKHNETGLLIEKGDPEKMAMAVNSLVNDPERKETMGVNSMKAVQAYYPDAVYEYWKALFSKNS